MDGMVREFALQMLRRLQKRQTEEQKRIASAGDENMEDGQLPAEDLVHSPYLPENIELPADKAVVLQHVELLFALSVKVPEFLDEYVAIIHHPYLCFTNFMVMQDFQFIRPDGTIRARSNSRASHQPHRCTGLKSWKIAHNHAQLSFRCRVPRIAGLDYLHRTWKTQLSTCRHREGFDQ